MSNPGGGEPPEDYPASVKKTLVALFGEPVALTVLFYTGTPDPLTFPSKLRAIFGDGARVVLEQLEQESPSGTRSGGTGPGSMFVTLVPCASTREKGGRSRA